MGGGHLQCTRVGFTWNLSLIVMLWGREVRSWVFWFCQMQNAGSMFTTFRGGSRGGNFQPQVDKSLLYPILNVSAHRPHTFYLPNEVSTGPNVDPLSLQILYLKMLYSEGRSGFPWTEPCHRTIFSQIKELEKENNCVVIVGSVNQRFVVLILTLRKRG